MARERTMLVLGEWAERLRADSRFDLTPGAVNYVDPCDLFPESKPMPLANLRDFLAARAAEPSSYGGAAAMFLAATAAFSHPVLQGIALVGAVLCAAIAALKADPKAGD